MTAEALLSRLEGVKRTGEGRWIARCPAHQDRSPSLSVREVEGRILIHDFAGCAAADIVAAVGWSLCDLFEDRQPFEASSRPSRLPLRDLVPLLRHEAHIVLIAGADLLANRAITDPDWQRLAEAVHRIEGVHHELA